MTDELRLLDGFDGGHTTHQIQGIVARAGVTPYGMFCQARREVVIRRDSLRSSKLSLDLIEVQLAELRSTWCWRLGRRRRLAKRRLALRIRHAEMEQESVVQGIASTRREKQEFADIVDGLWEQYGNLTPQQHQELDAAARLERTALRAALEMRVNGTVSITTAEILATSESTWSVRAIARARMLLAQIRLPAGLPRALSAEPTSPSGIEVSDGDVTVDRNGDVIA